MNSQQELKFNDIHAKAGVKIQIRHDGLIIWINVDGKVDKNIYPYRGRFAVRVCLGTYNTKEEAIAIRDKFLKEFKFEDEFIHSSLRV
jgi:hypothetical protein